MKYAQPEFIWLQVHFIYAQVEIAKIKQFLVLKRLMESRENQLKVAQALPVQYQSYRPLYVRFWF